MNAANRDLEDWGRQILIGRLPRWQELPSIDLYMDQVVLLMEQYLRLYMPDGDSFLTPAMINNYVKSKTLPPPVKKRYGRSHIAGLIFICILKQVLPIADIYDLLLRDTDDALLPEVYDDFCEALERSYALLVRAHLTATPIPGEELPAFSADALHLALLSGAAKAVAQRLLQP